MPSKSTAAEKDYALAQLGAALTVLAESVGATIPLQQVRMFLHVATRGEVPQADLAGASGVAQSSASRNLSILAEGLYGGGPGYGLLVAQEVPQYRRSNVVRLTEKGKALAWDMQQALAGRRSSPPQTPHGPS